METKWPCSFKENDLERVPELTGRILRTRYRTGMRGIRSYFRASQPKGLNDEVDDNDDLLQLPKSLEIFTITTKYLVTLLIKNFPTFQISNASFKDVLKITRLVDIFSVCKINFHYFYYLNKFCNFLMLLSRSMKSEKDKQKPVRLICEERRYLEKFITSVNYRESVCRLVQILI